MRTMNLIRKSLVLTLITLSMSIGFVVTSFAAVIEEPLIKDSFDDGLKTDNWQVVNDPSNTISFAGDAGTLRYVDNTGAEEVMMTTEPLTTGEGVIGYSVEFDFLYKSDDWGAWFGFAFNKTSIVKGLDWGKGGYLMGRITSLQINNPNDTVNGLSSVAPGALTTFQEMTPTIPTIANTNVRFKFVYTEATKELKLYYDAVSQTMDLTTVRNTFTFGSLSTSEDYHFAIVSSGAGLYELDNLKIQKLTAADPIDYVESDFETNVLPEEITLAYATKFSHGPAKALDLNNPTEGAMFLSKLAVTRNPNVDKALFVNYQQSLVSMTDDKKAGFVFGLADTTKVKTDLGVGYLYFVNKTVSGTTSTYVGATLGNGTTADQVLVETKLPLNLAGAGYIDVKIGFGAFNNVYVTLADAVDLQFKSSSVIGLFGFTGEVGTRMMIDNFESNTFGYFDQSASPDLFENFETDYLDSNLWEIYNYRDLRPGTEMPIFPTAKGIYIENGKLNFDVAGESARLITKKDYANVEVRFDLNDFNKPVTPMNEDGEIDGTEVPPTFYVALSFGYESTAQNFWNVPTIIFQARDGGAVIYTLNMNDNNVYPIEPSLLLNAPFNENETFEFKVVALNGKVDIWMKRASDPITLFDGEPLVTYYDVNTTGRVAFASSAAGSFKLDDISIVKVGGAFDKPVIEDSIDPATQIAPVITVNNNKVYQFEQNSTEVVDFKTYFSVTDNNQPVTITDAMINKGGFDLTKVGQYTVTLTVTDVDGNEAQKSITVSVYPEVIIPEQPKSNTVLVSTMTGFGSLAIGMAVTFIALKKVKKF